jgi:CDP-diacylglycerol--glycerol-3-phosphate 3-phosphatidyltransferase/cardiolipin synthase
LPGLVSALRLGFALAFPFAVDRPAIAAAVLVAAGASDVIDGWLARRSGEATAMGAVVDAVADKVFVAAVVVTLVLRRRLAGLEVVMLATREIFEAPILAWRLLRPHPFARERHANAIGKATTVLQFVTLLSIVLRLSHETALFACAGTGIFAGVAYAFDELAGRARPRRERAH